MLGSMKDILVRLSILLFFYDCATCLIIPEELPTILSLIYSNIPPIKKGTDSRFGVGFRLGEHADFQVLFELGPQTETEPIGTGDAKRRRDAMLSAAMRGELGPVAQAVAKYQMERRIRTELEKLQRMKEKLKKVEVETIDDKKTEASEWLSKWSNGMIQPAEDRLLTEKNTSTSSSSSAETKNVHQRIGRPPKTTVNVKDKFGELTDLYKLQNETQT